MGRSRYGRGITLSQVTTNGYLITIGCNLCRRRHHYLPTDLQVLAGDVVAYDVTRKAICETCKRGDYLTVKIWFPTDEERRGIILRRVDRITTVRRITWRMEPMG